VKTETSPLATRLISRVIKVRRPEIAASDSLADRSDLADFQSTTLLLLTSLQHLPAAGQLSSKTGRGTLQSDLLRCISSIASGGFDFNRTKPLLRAALANKPNSEI
jgi:hypothetical protein